MLNIPGLTPEGRRYFAELEKLADLVVQVGFQGDQTYEDGTSLTEVAAYNEFGSSDTPARPFMRQSFENHEDELERACAEVTKAIAGGGTAEQALQTLGLFTKSLVQTEIVEGNFAENAPSTVRKKGSAQPLIDTATMRGSVNFVVKRREGGA